MRIDPRLRSMLVIAGVVAALIAGASLPHPPLVIYNRTPSLPIGFYVYRGGRIQRGKIVAFALPAAAYSYAHLRGEPTNLILLKHVLAAGGDFVSALDGELRVNGVLIGPIASVDSAGRRLPHWSAARRLNAGELLVGSAAAHSFDSRFFGPIHVDEVIGIYCPIVRSFACVNRSADASSSDEASAFVLSSSQQTGLSATNGIRRCKHLINGGILNSIYGKIKAGYQPDSEAIEPQGLTTDSRPDSLYMDDISANQISDYRY